MAVPTAIRDKTAICGVGMTRIGRYPDRSPLSLVSEAFKLALEDSGLKKSDIDGLMVLNVGSDYDRTVEGLGLELRWSHQGWHHGRFISSMIMEAALLVNAGLADCMALVHAALGTRRAWGQDDESWRQGLGPHWESPAYGALAQAGGAAIQARRYFHMYGGGNEDLAPIAVAFRRHASMNPGAVRRQPITIEDHQSSRWIVDPLRLLDCCQINDGGSCLIITSAERARDCKKPPVYISGMQGVSPGKKTGANNPPGLGCFQDDIFRYAPGPEDLRVYEMAGITQKDVDAMSFYDAFTPYLLMSLERFGFCGPGEAREFVKGGRIEIGGELPVNTSGGLHSEGHLAGWNLFVEIVRQLRHECGERQVKDAQIIQWANRIGDSIVFRR